MKRLSSKTIYLYKIVFPVFWFGILGCFALIALFGISKCNDFDVIAFVMPIIIPLVMAAFGYFVMKKFVFDLINEVYDEGSSLLFKNGKKEVRVNLHEIKNVSYSAMVSPPRVTINLRRKTEFGDELSFVPPISFIPFKKNPDIVELIDRIDRARG